MILDKIIELICDEFGVDSADFDGDTLLETFVSDEFEMQALVDAIEASFEIELDSAPAADWTVDDLAQAVSEAY